MEIWAVLMGCLVSSVEIRQYHVSRERVCFFLMSIDGVVAQIHSRMGRVTFMGRAHDFMRNYMRAKAPIPGRDMTDDWMRRDL
jgi:hypothetical protein